MKNNKREKLVLVDGHALIHRAFHALPGLTTKAGQPVNAAYGFSMILLNALEEIRPKYGAVCFDLAKPTFRHREFEDYKAKRQKTPKELSIQIPLVKKIVKAFNIPIYEARGYEADDVVGSLAKQITKDNPKVEVIIVTGDLDMLQLVDENIFVYTMKRGLANTVQYDSQKVIKRYGFGPEYVVDYKGLKGDPSDNLPGVSGIGDKTAKELINKYGHLEDIYQELGDGLVDLSGRLRSNLEEQEKEARQSKDLATIRTDIKLDYDLSKMILSDYDKTKVLKLFKELEFKSLISKLPQSNEFLSGKNSTKETRDYQTITTNKQLDKLIEAIKNKGETVVDIETNTLDGPIIGVSFCFKAGQGHYLPIGQDFSLKDIKDLLEDESIKKIGHGIKYDYRLLLKNGVELKRVYFDTMIASYLLDPEKRNYKLDRLAFSQLGKEMIPLTDLMGKDYQTPLGQVDQKLVSDYSCEDSDMTYQLYKTYQKDLRQKGLKKLFEEIEMPLVLVLAKMENLGIGFDKNIVEKLKEKIVKELIKNKSEIIKITGEEINLNSPTQLREVIYHQLAISSQGIKRTKTGLSTSASELEKIKGEHPIVDLILKHRQLEKIRNTYIQPLLDRDENRIRTSFNQTATATGRLSSSDPNLQNIPTRTKLGQEVRKFFVAETGYRLVSFDYSQIELRIAAHLSGDKQLIQAFNDDLDIHKATASRLFGVEVDKVTLEQRDQAKTINFAVLYGMSPYGLSQSLGESRDYAKNFIDNYFKSFSGVKKYLDQVLEDLKKKGYVSTLMGRKRYFDLGQGRNRRQLERAAINTPIQGTAADLIKKAMIELDQELDLAKSLADDKPRLVLQVHDELIFEIKEEKLNDNFTSKIKEIMEGVIKLKVPLKVDLKIGDNWGEMKTDD